MSLKSFAVASVLALSTLAINAQASQTWTVTTQGHINYGWDSTGVFGAAGQDLAGLSFTQSITASIDPAQWTGGYSGGYFQYLNGSGPAFTNTVTVNGHSATFSVTTISGRLYISNAVSNGNTDGYYDYIYTSLYGNTAAGGQLETQQYAYSYTTAFVPTLDFTQQISQNTSDPSFITNSSFNISGNQTAYFRANFDTLTVNAVSAVPEPGTYAMLLAGLGLMGFVARRRA